MKSLVWLVALATLAACPTPPAVEPPPSDAGAGATTCASLTCGSHASCLAGPRCACDLGFSGDGQQCADVDECQSGAAGCSAYATCQNSVGSFSCSCKAGFTGDGKACADIDECQTGAAGCSADATCQNTPGGFTCTCKSGFSGDGKVCAGGF